MNVVGRLADAETSTILVPDAASVVTVTVGPLVTVAPKYPAGKFALKIRCRFRSGIAAVHVARRAERRAVDGLAQLRFDDVHAAGVHGEARKEQKHGDGACHVNQHHAFFI